MDIVDHLLLEGSALLGTFCLIKKYPFYEVDTMYPPLAGESAKRHFEHFINDDAARAQGED